MKLCLSLFALFSAVSGVSAADPENKGRVRSRGLQGDGSGDGVCFSRENTVEVQGKGHVSIDSVSVGDYIRVNGKGNFAQVYSWFHVDEEMEADFVQITAQGSEKPLELTGNHLVFVKDGASTKTVPAAEIKVGDMMIAEGGNDVEVLKIGNVKRTGIYAPFTTAGNLVVNGLVASNYATLPFFEKYGLPFSFHSVGHALGATHRVICSINFAVCEAEGHTEDGVSKSVLFYGTFKEMNFFQQAAVFWMLIPVAFASYAIEQVFLSVFLFNVVALAGAYALYKKYEKKASSQIKMA